MGAATEPAAEHSGALERLYRAEYDGMVRLAYIALRKELDS